MNNKDVIGITMKLLKATVTSLLLFGTQPLWASAPTDGPLKQKVLDLGINKIVFAERGYQRDSHWYANFGYYALGTDKKTYGQNNAGKLKILSIDDRSVKTLINDPKGGVRDPQLSYDGKTIIFSYRKGGTDHYHLYTVNIDGTNLKQLTDGPYDDIEPSYVANGKVMFVSSRAQRWVNCWHSQVAVVYRMDPDGTNIERLSANVEHDNSPWPLLDGRIIYTRWEYVDRSQLAYHHLWTMNPDGTSQQVYFGNMHPDDLYIDAKPIPGTNEILAVMAKKHGNKEHGGSVIRLSDEKGPDDKSALITVANAPNKKDSYRDPFPLTKDIFLVSKEHKLLVMNQAGESEVLLELPRGIVVNEPRPVISREKEQFRPDLTDLSKQNGKLILTNVNIGRNMKGVKPGQIKNLLVVETLPKPVNYSGSMEPTSLSGTYTMERILGKIPVEADGSAYMELPAKRPLFFIALDEKDQAVKRMQSFLTVQPGETLSCVGCHEQRTKTPVSQGPRGLMAMKRPASTIQPVSDVPHIFDFPKDIQPILDKHCTECHNADERKGGIQMTGDMGPIWTQSYYWLSMLEQLGDNRNRKKSNYEPYKLGDAASELMSKIKKGHHGVKMPAKEQKMIQYWLHAGAPYIGSYAGLGSGMIGGDFESHAIERGDLKLPTMQKFQEVVQKRCGDCHHTVTAKPKKGTDLWSMNTIYNTRGRGKYWGKKPKKKIVSIRPLPNSTSDVLLNAEAAMRLKKYSKLSRHNVFNLTNPEDSVYLKAALSEDAGGYASCRQVDGKKVTKKPHAVFTSKDDPDYQIMLKAITEMSDLMKERKRWYMDGFKPHPAYIREMKRYGILDKSFDVDKDPINVYETDEKYFRQQTHIPMKK